MKYRSIFILVLSGMLLTGCAEKSLKDQREAQARAASVNTPIEIGFVWPFSAEYDLLPEGVYMAVKEINNERVVCDTPEVTSATPESTANAEETALPEATGEATDEAPVSTETPRNCRIERGLLGGRMIQLVERDDQDLVREGRLIAQEYAEDPNITAVIGHAWSYISVPAAPLYEFNGLIMLSPSSTSPELTDKGYQYIFRNVLNDNETGRQLAIYAHQQGYKRLVILYADGSYGRQLSNVVENMAVELDMAVVDRRPYEGTRNFLPVLEEWTNLDFDAIIIAGTNPDAAVFILNARRMGLQQPVIGSDGLDTIDLWDSAGTSGIGTVVGSFFAADIPDPELQGFIIRFQDDNAGKAPDTWAALGYDAMWLLADAITRAGSTVPSEVAAKMHETKDWQGVTGIHTFNEQGDVVGKPLVLKIQEEDGLKFLQLAATQE